MHEAVAAGGHGDKLDKLLGLNDWLASPTILSLHFVQ